MIEVIVAVIGLVGIVTVARINNNSKINTIQAELTKSVGYQKDNYMALLRLTLMNPEVPIDERIAAGRAYVDNGGNGGTKAYYHKLLEAYGLEDNAE